MASHRHAGRTSRRNRLTPKTPVLVPDSVHQCPPGRSHVWCGWLECSFPSWRCLHNFSNRRPTSYKGDAFFLDVGPSGHSTTSPSQGRVVGPGSSLSGPDAVLPGGPSTVRHVSLVPEGDPPTTVLCRDSRIPDGLNQECSIDGNAPGEVYAFDFLHSY